MQHTAASPVQARIFTRVISTVYFQVIEVEVEVVQTVSVSVSLSLRAVSSVAAPVPSAIPHPGQSRGATGPS